MLGFILGAAVGALLGIVYATSATRRASARREAAVIAFWSGRLAASELRGAQERKALEEAHAATHAKNLATLKDCAEALQRALPYVQAYRRAAEAADAAAPAASVLH